MIIVSQGKDELVNFDRIESIWIDVEEGRVTIEATADTNSTLGTYSTEERAKEVLQEIIKVYLDCNVEKVLAEYAYVKNIVFEMPTK